MIAAARKPVEVLPKSMTARRVGRVWETAEVASSSKQNDDNESRARNFEAKLINDSIAQDRIGVRLQAMRDALWMSDKLQFVVARDLSKLEATN